ncbi:MAG: LysR family transcriptional regulator [Clostridia bacterium]|nr:LysR family transcriptional regulator [Clostridia bacterium]
MDTKEVLTFLTLSQTLSYQRAAEKLQYARSTIFSHIQTLEQELGVPLFVKNGRQLELTEQGRMFRPYAVRVMSDYQEIMERFTGITSVNGSVTIGGCEVNTANSLLKTLNLFSTKYPQIHLRMMTSPNASVPDLVRGDLVDMGYYYGIGHRRFPGVQCVDMYEEPVYLVAARENPLTKRAHVVYEELQGMNFVHPHDNCCFATELLTKLRQRDVQLGKVSYVGGVQLVVDQAHRRNALTLTPQSALERYEEAYDMVRLQMDEEPIWAWECIIHKDFELLKPEVKTLIRFSLKTLCGGEKARGGNGM